MHVSFTWIYSNNTYMYVLVKFTFREYSEEDVASYASFQVELKKWSTSLMVDGTMAGFIPAGVMMLGRRGDEEGDKVDTHLRS